MSARSIRILLPFIVIGTPGQTDIYGNAIADSYVRYKAYGSVRSGNPSALSTDRTFTGQKQDGTGYDRE